MMLRLLLLVTLVLPAAAEQVTFRHVIELALKNSTTMAIANADQKHAEQGVAEIRGLFLPQVTLGSGLAYSNGFPLSLEGAAPSVFSVNSTQFLFNAAGRDYLRAVRSDLSSANKSSADKRAQVIYEVAMAYTELDKLDSSIQSLGEQVKTSARVEKVVQERLSAGVDPEVELTKARLGSARVRLAMANAQGQADVLRLRLSQMTGLPVDSIQTVNESIPRLPDVSQQPASSETNLQVQAANEQAAAKTFRAKAEHKQSYPAIDFAGQYGLFSRFNNYDEFFRKFQRNNLTIGVVIRFPFLNFAQKARSEAASADAVKAKKEAEAVKNMVATDTLKLQRSVEQLAAARDVAKLEYQLASADSQAAQAKLVAGTATVRDQENTLLVESQRYAAYLDAILDLDKAQMQLLRATGEIEKWALEN